MVADEGGRHDHKGEYQRLRRVLREAEGRSTLEEDEALLAGVGALPDWRHQAIVQFRVLRKRALRHMVAQLRRQLLGEPAHDEL